MLLVFALTLSLLSSVDFSGIALAAPPDITSSSFTATTSADAGNQSKPKLHIDFLGDNNSHINAGSAPSTKHQGSFNPHIGTSSWSKYSSAADAGTVFWVGVGIDKMSLFELSKGGKGLTGLELGFYYNTDYVVPYVGDAATSHGSAGSYNSGYNYNDPAGYLTQIQAANLAPSPNSLNQWDSDFYHIEEAIPVMDPVVDQDTQEFMAANPAYNPSNPGASDLIGTGSTWKMAYVSLERTLNAGETAWAAGTQADNRFASGTFADTDVYYVMMLPFVVKAYDASERICFRLARNASGFSMGGGDYGAGTYDDSNAASSYGAWEQGTRTPGHNLKEMFDFEGDLNIFTGANESDTAYNVSLKLVNLTTGRRASLYPSDDDSIFVTAGDSTSSATMTGVTQGRELTVEVAKQSGDSVLVSVTTSAGAISYTEVTAGEKYTFVMPQANVTVTITYITAVTDAKEYQARLILVDPDAATISTLAAVNTATLTGNKDGGTSNATSASGTYILVRPGLTQSPTEVTTLEVRTHPDYQAKVSVKTKTGLTVPVTGPTETGTYPNITYTYTYVMPSADVDVTVTYSKRETHIAELAVVQDESANGDANNYATLSYDQYDYSNPPVATNDSISIAQKGAADNHLALGPIPEARPVTLDVYVASGTFMVSQVRMYEKYDDGTYSTTYTDLKPLLTTISPTQWRYVMPMPNHAIEIVVTFAKGQNYEAVLKLVNAGMVTDNTLGAATMTGDQGGGSVITNTVTVNDTTNPTNPSSPILIWPGNTVTVNITPKPGYRVKSVKVRTDNPYLPTVSYSGSVAVNDSPSTITYVMPNANVTVTVAFEEIPKDKYNLTLKFQPNNPSSYNITQSGWPDNPALMTYLDYPSIYDNVVGSVQTAWVQVEPTWYIASVKVVGIDESPMGSGTGSGTGYPVLSISGNGYNNGAGGQVVIQVAQPPENATLYVELKKGPPSPEPPQGLRLMVSDPDNKVNNWAKVSVNGGTAAPASGVTSTYNSGNGYAVSSITAGDVVDVTFNVDTDYYVSDVVVTPSSYGVVPTWIGSNSVQFLQPAGSATVTVYFKKIDPAAPPYKVYLHAITPQGTDEGTLTSGSTLATPSTATVNTGTLTDGPIPAWPGDIFTTSAQLSGTGGTSGYALVYVYRGGLLVPWTATGTGTDGAGTFVMPSGSDVHVYMEFRTTLPSPNTKWLNVSAHETGGTAAGVAGKVEVYEDGTAPMTVDGTLVGTANSNGTPYAAYTTIGKTIKLSALPQPGYIVDYIAYSPAGSITPVMLALPAGAGSQAVRFTMPANAQSVAVYFKKGAPASVPKYMANITIWPPAGSTVSQVGDAWFTDPSTPTANYGYAVSEPAGTGLRVKAYANSGYYIKKIEITPASLGISSPVTGVFATQTVDFIMPNANCIVNIYYERGWPDGIHATLNVHGPSGVAGNTAQMFAANATPSATSVLTAGGSETLSPITPGDVVKVKINVDPTNPPGYTLVYPVSIHDAHGNNIPYWWSGAGEISFSMPGTWVVVDVTFDEGTDPYSLKATLMDTSGDSNLSATTIGTVTANQVTGLHPGEQVVVTITPGSTTAANAGKVPVVTVFGDPSNTPIATAALTESSGIYTTSFFMQAEDAKIFVSYVSPPGTNEHISTLIATQTNGTPPGGTAKMFEKLATAKTTGLVSSVGSDSVSLEKDKVVVIEATPSTVPNFVIQSVRVTRMDTGAVVTLTPTGLSSGTYTYEFTMPDAPVLAVVTFREKTAADDSLTAQIVVNNGGDAGNTAFIREFGDPATSNTNLLTPLSVGDHITVDVASVAPGYELDLVMISPTLGGAYTIPIGPSGGHGPLNMAETYDFYMPADDVIVYVRFKPDGVTRYNIRLKVQDTTPLTPPNYNTATIHTAFSGTSTPVSHHGFPTPDVVVKGAPTELVTVTTYPLAGYYAVVTAVSDDSAATPVTDLTVEPDGLTYTFSAPSNNVYVLVEYYLKPVTQTHNVRLHVTNLGTASGTTSVSQTSAPTNVTTVDGGSITVPYLDQVSVSATATSGYLQAAYAMFGTVTLPIYPGTLNETFSGGDLIGRGFDFLMQNGDVDVYVIYSDTPAVGPYTVGLTVTGPSGEPEGAAGSANLENTTATVSIAEVVPSNRAYNYAKHTVTSTATDSFEVRIKVNPGYTIDTVTVNPLVLGVVAIPGGQDPLTQEYIYTFSMTQASSPSNLTVNVKLKAAAVTRHTVTLKELTDAYMTANPTATSSLNHAEVTYTVYTLDAQGDTMQVPETQLVTIQVEPGAGYYVHHAYAVTKSGKMLILKNHTPSGIANLQNLNGAATATAQFEMPTEDVNVYIEFKNSSDTPTGTNSAVLTVTDSTNSGLSQKITLTNTTLPIGAANRSTKADSDGVTSLPPVSINAGDTLVVDWAGKIAPGYVVDSITVTGTGLATDPVHNPGAGDTSWSYTVPPSTNDLGFIVRLKSTTIIGYKATLHIVDHSSAIGNAVTMQSGSTVKNADGDVISGLSNGAVVATVAVPKPGVVVRAVMATDGSGTRPLSLSSGQYDYTIAAHDVDITVIFDNASTSEPMYVAMVTKTGETEPSGNTAAVVNKTNPALPNGDIWTGIYASNRLQVNVTTDTSGTDTYYARIIARNASDTSGYSRYNVLQLGITGTVTGYLDVPASLAENIIIEVNYSKIAPTTTADLTLTMSDANANAGNTSTLTDSGTPFTLTVDGSMTVTQTQSAVPAGTALTLANTITAGYLKEITLESGGVKITLPVTTGSIVMPTANAAVTVYVESGARTARPHDQNQHPSGNSYIDGYLIGQNLGGNKAQIQVHNLYETASSTMMPAYDEPTKYYEYNLYYNAGGTFVKLIRGVDYEVIAFNSFDPVAPNTVTAGHSDTGWQFTIRSLIGESPLTELLLNGTTANNLLYITATEVDSTGAALKDESEFVEVILPADPNKGSFIATLHIVDNSGVTGNVAEMNAKGTTVNTHGAQITNLNGDELVRTVATPASGARVTAVTVTDSAGTRLLDKIPSGTTRYPYYMTGESIIITVFFESDPPTDPLTRYIATVTKMGAMGVPGNNATIKNDDRNDLSKGSIWAEGNPTNDMRVTVSIAEGYYATLTAYRKDQGPGAGDLVVTAFGAGPGAVGGSTFDAIFQMPSADVQVVVTYTKEAPANLNNELVLRMVGTFGTAVNAAQLAEQTSGTPTLNVIASATTTDQEKSTLPGKVAAGTQFDLTTTHGTGYYIVSVKAYIPNKTSPTSTVSIPLDASGAGVFTMPLGRAEVEVEFDNTARTPRPYDPIHSVAYNSANYPSTITDLSSPTQEGWIEATPQAPVTVTGGTVGQIEVLIPTLHNDEHSPINAPVALSDAGVATNTPAATYTFYWKDSFGTYHNLTSQITLSNQAHVVNAYGSHTGYQLTLTANTPGSLIDYILKTGGKIYVTAKDATNAESDYTQIIVPRYFKATLFYTPTPATAGAFPDQTADMFDGTIVTSTSPVIDHGASINKLNGTETITIDNINNKANKDTTNYVLVGVVATTDVGSVNATRASNTKYSYDMVQKDVAVTVVYNTTSDPLNPKGPHIVTVLKTGDDGLSGNGATVEDLDVTIPAYQKDVNGSWTAAYEGNVIEVDTTAESGYYVKSITAVEKNRTSGPATTIKVVRYGTRALFYMPDHADVDVTVEYAAGTAPTHKLTLKVDNAGSNSDNKATITFPDTSTLAVNGLSPITDDRLSVAADTQLKLTTSADTANGWSVAGVVMTVAGETIDIPLTDGTALPEFAMPLDDAVVTVTFQSMDQTPRPYDPKHANYYTSAYSHGSADDLSRTHQDGWIRAATTGTDSFTVTVPTLHDMSGIGASTNQLFDALGTVGGYKLYWRDNMGNFRLFTTADITITGGTVLNNYYTDSTPISYDGFTFDVKVKSPQTLWNGYTLNQYLSNGGSIYISAVDSAKGESEKTEVVITAKAYTATLKYLPNGVTPNGATMTVGTKTTTNDGGVIADLVGTETVVVDSIVKPTGFSVVGVVATTASGSVNVQENPSGTFNYTMVQEDVILQVVYVRDDDPFQSKGPYIVTVKKVNHDNEAGNTATVKDLDVTIPAYQKGNIWTAAYEGNTVRVDVGFASGYYALITATEKATGNSVTVAQFAALGSTGNLTGCYGLFEMPGGTDVDVTVTYIKASVPNYKLTLEVAEDGTAINSMYNTATVEITHPTNTTSTPNATLTADCDPVDSTRPTPTDTDTAVPTGSALELTTGHYAGWSVKEAVLIVAGINIPVPLTDGVSVPVPVMPFGDATLKVTYWNYDLTPRPYDPNRAHYYNSNYNHNNTPSSDPADVSATHQDGWILAENLGSDSFAITVPTLHDLSDLVSPYHKLHNADTAAYKLYWKDEMGIFHDITEGATVTTGDVERTGDAAVTGSYTDTIPSTNVTYDGRKLTFKVNKDTTAPNNPTLWGGYKLLQYLANGGSVYITSTLAPGVESEKTEVVILGSSVLRPYDPDRVNPASATNPDYEDHWIRAENRGSYLLVTVPILNKKDGSAPTDVDGDIHRLQFHLQTDASKKTDASSMVNVTDFLNIVNVKGYQVAGSGEINTYYQSGWAPTPTYLYEAEYENDNYWSDTAPGTPVDYDGARFIITLKDGSGLTGTALTNYNTVKSIFDNAGTMAATSPHRMYITSDIVTAKTDPLPPFSDGDYVDFEVPVYYTLSGILESYAPKHAATLEFYKDSGTGLIADGAKPDHVYSQAPVGRGKGLWQRSFDWKSSELRADWILRITKPGHVTYEQKLKLGATMASPDVTGGTVYTLIERDSSGNPVPNATTPNTAIIPLLGGDIDQDGRVALVDREVVLQYIETPGYTRDRAKTTTNEFTTWPDSVFNPVSIPYAADLDGDGNVGMLDLSVIMSERNMGKNAKVYTPVYPKGATSASMLDLEVVEVPTAEELAALAQAELEELARTALNRLAAISTEETTDADAKNFAETAVDDASAPELGSDRTVEETADAEPDAPETEAAPDTERVEATEDADPAEFADDADPSEEAKPEEGIDAAATSLLWTENDLSNLARELVPQVSEATRDYLGGIALRGLTEEELLSLSEEELNDRIDTFVANRLLEILLPLAEEFQTAPEPVEAAEPVEPVEPAEPVQTTSATELPNDEIIAVPTELTPVDHAEEGGDGHGAASDVAQEDPDVVGGGFVPDPTEGEDAVPSDPVCAPDAGSDPDDHGDGSGTTDTVEDLDVAGGIFVDGSALDGTPDVEVSGDLEETGSSLTEEPPESVEGADEADLTKAEIHDADPVDESVSAVTTDSSEMAAETVAMSDGGNFSLRLHNACNLTGDKV